MLKSSCSIFIIFTNKNFKNLFCCHFLLIKFIHYIIYYFTKKAKKIYGKRNLKISIKKLFIISKFIQFKYNIKNTKGIIKNHSISRIRPFFLKKLIILFLFLFTKVLFILWKNKKCKKFF